MKKKRQFFVGYQEDRDKGVFKESRKFLVLSLILLMISALVFAITQNEFKNSTFELTEFSKVTGTYFENPYPILQVNVGGLEKDILLLGFGKSGVNPYLADIREDQPELDGSILSIEGNLIYYNGKTLLQITDKEKILLVKNPSASRIPKTEIVAADVEITGEIVDPKCYFGVMKPGYGKIHRSCAVRCISGGIPPVLASVDDSNKTSYYLITDETGNPLHKEILEHVGKPSILKGEVVKIADWYQLRIQPTEIKSLNLPSRYY